MEVDEDLAPLHEGTTATIRATSLSGIANRYVSLKPGPNNADEIDDGGEIGADETNAPVDIDMLFNTLDDEDARGPAQLHPRLRRPGTTARAQEAGESTKYFAPFLSSTTRPDAASWRSTSRCSSASCATAPTTVSAIAERRDDLAALVGQHQHGLRRDRRRERRRSAAALELLPEHAAQGQHDVREPALDARRPRRARERVEAGHARPRAVLPRSCARWCATRGRRSPTCATLIRAPGAEQRPDRAAPPSSRGWRELTVDGLPARDPRARPRAAGVRVRARLHARPRRLAHQVRPGRRATTTPTATTRASSRCSARRNFDQATDTLNGDTARRSGSTASRRATATAAPAARPALARRLRARGRSRAATRPRPRPAHEAARLDRRCSWRSCRGS